MSRAMSGEPWLGLTSIENGEKPQSSVEPSWSLGMCLAAASNWLRTSSGDSMRGFSGLMTPIQAICLTPFASLRMLAAMSL